MAVERDWAWNLDEMRDADAQPEAQESQFPMVSGFTPINGPRKTEIESKPIPEHSPDNKKPKKAPAPKRRKIESSSFKAAPKAHKPPGSRKIQSKKKTGEPKCQDIAKDLARTKLITSGNRVSTDKTEISSEATLVEQGADVEMLNVVSSDRKDAKDTGSNGPMRHLGLAEKYQAAYAKAIHNGIDPRLLQKNDGSWGASEDPDAAADPNFPLGLLSSTLTLRAEASMQRESWDDDNKSLQDFEVPPSAQRERFEGPGDPPPVWQDTGLTKAVCQSHFNSDEVFGDCDDGDDFPMGDDEDLGEIMQAVDPSEILGTVDVDDWRPQDFTDDPLIFEELDDKKLQQDVTSSHWVTVSTHENPKLPPDNRIETSPSRQANVSSRVLSQTSGNAVKAGPNDTQLHDHSEDCFDDNDLDEDLVDLAMNGSDLIQPQTPVATPKKPRSPKLQWMPPRTFTPAKSSQLLKSPISTPHSVPVNQKGYALPFTRPPFPKPIRDRSPILGLTNQTVLRTCFRIGEALNAAAVASRSNADAMIELFARIVLSEREANNGYKQFFQFGDLFTDKPPYLNGTYSLWKGIGLWDVDSRVFIGEKGRGKMARVMGRIKKCESGSGCEMVVLSIWEVDWEDVEVAKGIVCS